MNTITKFKADDGTEFNSVTDCAEYELLCAKVDKIMAPLGDVPKEVEAGEGWLQHDLETVNVAKDAILQLCRNEGFANSFDYFKARGRDCHPLSIIGRILSDNDGPLADAWGRFGRIDPSGREHQQCYFAYTNGPDKSHICVEDRSKLERSNPA